MKAITILIAVLLFAGCAATVMEASIDRKCSLVAEQQALTWGGHAPNPLSYRDFDIECLEYMGWTAVEQSPTESLVGSSPY